jgi:hypothetical protein
MPHAPIGGLYENSMITPERQVAQGHSKRGNG